MRIYLGLGWNFFFDSMTSVMGFMIRMNDQIIEKFTLKRSDPRHHAFFCKIPEVQHRRFTYLDLEEMTFDLCTVFRCVFFFVNSRAGGYWHLSFRNIIL